MQGLAAFSTTCPQRDEVALFLDKLCHSLLKDPKQFHRMLLHDLGGPMMLEAAQGGLPHNSAIRASPELFANPTPSPVHCVLKPEQSYRNQALCPLHGPDRCKPALVCLSEAEALEGFA